MGIAFLKGHMQVVKFFETNGGVFVTQLKIIDAEYHIGFPAPFISSRVGSVLSCRLNMPSIGFHLIQVHVGSDIGLECDNFDKSVSGCLRFETKLDSWLNIDEGIVIELLHKGVGRLKYETNAEKAEFTIKKGIDSKTYPVKSYQ